MSIEKSTPGFIREFSKENSKEERDVFAEKIRTERTEHAHERWAQDESAEQIKQLEQRLNEYNSDSFTGKIRDYLKMKAVKQSLGIAQSQKAALDESIASRNPNESGMNAIAALYEDEKKKWASAEYGKEDIAKYFTEENLASLSLEDYALLMKRFPSEMVTHVTRQGIRDHTGMVYHTAGAGEFQDGFNLMTQDGRLRSPLAVNLAEAQKQNEILKMLNWQTLGGELKTPQNRIEAQERLADWISNYTDRNAVHFAAECVGDHYYGSERGNEIFVAYPSVFIAAQYHFGYRPLTGGVEEMHNDVWVWDTEQRGMNLDAAIVFLPKNARVDAHTGSRYKISPEGKPIPHESIPTVMAWVTSPEFIKMSEAIQEATGQIRWYEYPPIEQMEEIAESSNVGSRRDVAKKLLPIKRSLESAGITDPRILKQIMTYSAARNLYFALQREKDEPYFGDGYHVHQAVKSILEDAGTPYVEAKETISSEEYWEKKFLEHPEKRPSKIVYYEGEDPGAAMRKWQEENGLVKKAKDEYIGFPEHHVDTESNEAQSGINRFKSLMQKAIDDRFPEILN